jgi:hypothetical protein
LFFNYSPLFQQLSAQLKLQVTNKPVPAILKPKVTTSLRGCHGDDTRFGKENCAFKRTQGLEGV